MDNDKRERLSAKVRLGIYLRSAFVFSIEFDPIGTNFKDSVELGSSQHTAQMKDLPILDLFPSLWTNRRRGRAAMEIKSVNDKNKL